MDDLTDRAGRSFVSEVSRDLHDWIKRVRQNQSTHLPTPDELKRLRARIGQAGKIVARHRGSSEEAEWHAEISAYREALEQLSAFLREFEVNLLIRRAELSAAQTRLQSTNEWAAAVKRFG